MQPAVQVAAVAAAGAALLRLACVALQGNLGVVLWVLFCEF